MKIYISADIEGVTGVTSWSETCKGSADYEEFKRQMQQEVNSAIKGCMAGGATNIWVKDAHETGRNLSPNECHKDVTLIRGWSGHPFSMVEMLDETFDGVIFIGYHSGSSSNKNPLSHTMNVSKIKNITINDKHCNEFLIHAYAAAYVSVPVLMATGDEGLCKYIGEINEDIKVVSVKSGVGNSTINISTHKACVEIENSAREVINNYSKKTLLKLPKDFVVEIDFVNHKDAYSASFYPGMKQLSSTKVVYESKDYFDVLKMISFVVV